MHLSSMPVETLVTNCDAIPVGMVVSAESPAKRSAWVVFTVDEDEKVFCEKKKKSNDAEDSRYAASTE